jgi:hypothetical protein
MTEKNPTDDEPPLVWWAKWLHDHWPRIASAVGTAGLAGTGIWFSVKGKEAHWCAWLVFGFAVVAWIVGEVCGWRQEEKLSSLRKQLKDVEASRLGLEQLLGRTHGDYFALFQDQLSILANDVFTLTDRERISVYKHDGTAFVMLGRYSKNPVYNKKGRVIYPDNEGCIAEAWKDGESVIRDLPDPNSDFDTYATAHKTGWNINKQVAKAFQMKSRSYVALAVEDRLQKRIAVVVFESTCSNGALDNGRIKKLLDSYEGKRIAQFLDKMRAQEPSPAYAHEEGY